MSAITWVDYVSLVISGVTALSIFAAAVQIVAQSRQMHRDFEALYVGRYWSLMDLRSMKFTRGGTPRRKDIEVIHRYLQLCEDQIDLRKRGRVTTNTWHFWEQSIRAQVSSPHYKLTLRGSMDDEYPSLRWLMKSEKNRDPLPWGKWKRWRKGLQSIRGD